RERLEWPRIASWTVRKWIPHPRGACVWLERPTSLTMRVVRLLLLLLCLAIMGCYQSYTGIYAVRAQDAPGSLDQLPDKIFPAIRRFGFREASRGPSTIAFARGLQATDPDVAKLRGADAEIYVSIATDPAVIAIRDMDNTTETPFVAALKESIQTQ